LGYSPGPFDVHLPRISSREEELMSKVSPIPEGRAGVRPYICVNDAALAITFYTNVFGAKELIRLAEPGGKIGHAELEIGGQVLQLSDEYVEFGVKSPTSIGGSPVTLTLYVEDADRVAKTFIAHGGREQRPIADQFYGDRGGKFIDPFGHIWWIATRIEDLTPAQMQERARAQR
jgi:PhnB protein